MLRHIKLNIDGAFILNQELIPLIKIVCELYFATTAVKTKFLLVDK